MRFAKTNMIIAAVLFWGLIAGGCAAWLSAAASGSWLGTVAAPAFCAAGAAGVVLFVRRFYGAAGGMDDVQSVIRNMPQAVFIIDEKDSVLFASREASRVFNFDFGGYRGKSVYYLVDPQHHEFIAFLREHLHGNVPVSRQKIGFSKDGRNFDCIVSNMVEQDGKSCGAVITLNDVTHHQKLSQLKTDLVNHVSHEFKTPLASIAAYSEMLLDGEAKTTQTRNEFYSIIQNQANRLNKLVEDMLNTSRIEAGMVRPSRRLVNIGRIVDEQLKVIKSCAGKKDIRIVKKRSFASADVFADADLISQAVLNLLGNAVKYTQRGGLVKVDAEIDREQEIIRVSVSDNGDGIGPEELAHVFDKFYRAGSGENNIEGSGLGLNLVKQIVEKIHNGRVFAESFPGDGSIFGFELPLATTGAVSLTK